MPKKFSTVSRDANLCHHFQNKLEGCCISVCMTMSRLKPIGMKIVAEVKLNEILEKFCLIL